MSKFGKTFKLLRLSKNHENFRSWIRKEDMQSLICQTTFSESCYKRDVHFPCTLTRRTYMVAMMLEYLLFLL